MLRLVFALALLLPGAGHAADPAPRVIRGVSAAQLFEAAQRAEQAGDDANARTFYTALEHDPNVDIRSEARFRHALLLEREGKLVDAALLLRAILDERPAAQRVRLELAKIQALTGDENGAYRSLRQAQAGGLPPDVLALVNQFALALRSHKPVGASFELALAPDSNINRSTSSETLDTVIAPLQLSRDARRQSGVGVKPSGQAYLRLPLAANLNVVARASEQAALYRKSEFDDIIGSAALGLEWSKGRSRWSPALARAYRWYGGKAYSRTDSVSLDWQRLMGTKAQLQMSASVGNTDNRLNDAQDGGIFGGSVAYERALSARSGGSVTLDVQRVLARDPGYADWSGGFGAVYWHELGKLTVSGSIQYQRLRADARLLLFPELRRDTYWRAGMGILFRNVELSGFSPVLRVSRELNRSTVGLYDYRRNLVELGISRTF